MAYHSEDDKEIVPPRRSLDDEPCVQPKKGAYPREDLGGELGVTV